MLIHIDTADHRPLYLQIFDEVRRAITVGTLQPGDPLPSVRQTAGDLRINPNTVQQAYRELERAGIVEVRRGRGTFVSETVESAVDRRQLARSLAQRALQEARRHGLDPGELLEALRLESAETDSSKDRS